jgi:hypothetical protein
MLRMTPICARVIPLFSVCLLFLLSPGLAKSPQGITEDNVGKFGGREELSADELSKTIDRVSDWQPRFSVYSFYLLNIPLDSADVLTSDWGPPVQKWYPITKIQAKGLGFVFGTPPTMLPGKKTIFVAPSAKEERFVWVNGLPQNPPTMIPVGIARGLADSFLAGLITSFFLNSYGSEFNVNVSIISDVDVAFSELPQNDRAKLPQLSDPKTYGYTSKHKVSEDEFVERISTLSREINLQPTGMLLGWKCANEILKSSDRAELEPAIWKLVRNRFSGREIARISAYTTCYLEGWAQGTDQRTKKTPAIDKLETVFQDLGKTVTPPKDRLAIKFYNHLLGIYTVAASSQSQSEEHANTMKIMRDLLEGYYEGTVAASDDLFQAAYKLGFNQGIEKGLKDSYTAGFVLAKQSQPADEHLKVAGLLNTGIGTARTALEQTPWGRAAKTAADIANQIPGVGQVKAKASNWVSKRIGFKVKF